MAVILNNQRFIGNVSTAVIKNYCSYINSISSVSPFINRNEWAHDMMRDLHNENYDRSKNSPEAMLICSIINTPEIAPRVERRFELLYSRPKDGRVPNDCFSNAIDEHMETGNEMEWGLWVSNPASKSVSAVWHAVNRDAEGKFYDTQPSLSATPGRPCGWFIPSIYTHRGITQMLSNTLTGRGETTSDVRYDLYMLVENGRFHIVREHGAYFDTRESDIVREGERKYLGWMTWGDGDMPVSHLCDVPLVVK